MSTKRSAGQCSSWPSVRVCVGVCVGGCVRIYECD